MSHSQETSNSQEAYLGLRYEHVKCATCGRRAQRMDFYGNPHMPTCSAPKLLEPCACADGPCPLDKGAHLGSHYFCRSRSVVDPRDPRSRPPTPGVTQHFRHLDREVCMKDLAAETGISLMTLYRRWCRGDRNERLVRPMVRR